jgi:voltage-dependent calcium channel T type alpha-1G
VTNRKFEYLIIVFIIVSAVQLALDSPLIDPDSELSLTLYWIDVSTTIVFSLEAILKMLTFGLLFNGKTSYLKNPWNLLDLLIIVLSYISLSPLSDKLNTIKMVRIVRALRIISRNDGLKVAVKALMLAVPNISNVTVIMLLFFMIFGIVSVSFFKGKFFYCLPNGETWTAGLPADSKWDCLNAGGNWINKDFNFDNVGIATITLFVMATTSGWSDIMNYSVTSTDIDYVASSESSIFWTFFFISFIIVGSFFFLNLFIGVVISTFNSE